MSAREIRHRAEIGAELSARRILGAVAEVGVAEGRFSLEILAWGVSRLYLVDAWREMTQAPPDNGRSHWLAAGLPESLWNGEDVYVDGIGDAAMPQEWHDANLAKVQKVAKRDKRVTILRGLSIEMAAEVPDGSLSLAYLDAGHGYSAVKADLLAWWPKVAPGGILAGHDYLGYHGVRRAADEFAARLGLTLRVIREHKDEDAGFWVEKAAA